MDHSQSYCDCGRTEALGRAERAEEKASELTTLLAEAAALLFVEAGKPSKELFQWWYRREHYAKIRAERAK